MSIDKTRKRAIWSNAAVFLSASFLSACGGGGSEGGSGNGGGTPTPSNFLLGYVGGFLYDDGGTNIELTSVSDFNTISSLATAVTSARNAATFAVQQFSQWQDIFGPGAFPSNSNWSYAAIKLEYARGAGLTGAGQTIAIYDNGFRLSHDELSADGRTVTDVNSTAINDHGTAVASIAAGSESFGIMEGVAPNANLRLFGWASSGGGSISWEDSIQDAAANGVIAHNNSWALSSLGGSVPGISSNDLTLFESAFPEVGFLDDLTNFASNAVVVFAADNDETRTDSHYLAALPTLVPELEQGWLKVINLFVPYNAPSNSFGTPVRLSAGCFEAARWCLGADGSMIFANSSGDTSYSVGTGASFAAPQVAGAMALLGEAFPTLSAAELRNRLLASADNSFFAHTDQLVFEGGYAHGFNTEYGHGLMDLRAALLPIGTMSTLSANGVPLNVGEASVVSGGASGDTLMQGLSKINVLSTDQMRGDYLVNASSFAARSTAPNRMVLDAARVHYADLTSERATARMGSGGTWESHSANDGAIFDAIGQASLLDDYDGPQFGFVTDNNTRFSMVLSAGSEDSVGIEASHVRKIGGSILRFDVSAAQSTGSVLGIQSVGTSEEFNSVSTELGLALSIPLDDQSAFGLSGRYGAAWASGAGLIREFDRLDFSSFGASYSRSDIFRPGDNLTLLVERPVKIVGGSAHVEAASGRTTLGQLDYATHRIGLSPSANQVDIGFDFRSPLSDSTELHLGVRRSINSGHISGEESTTGLVRFRWAF